MKAENPQLKYLSVEISSICKEVLNRVHKKMGLLHASIRYGAQQIFFKEIMDGFICMVFFKCDFFYYCNSIRFMLCINADIQERMRNSERVMKTSQE